MKLLLLCLCSVVAIVAGQRITTIQLDGVQYFVSRMNPYSPELNYFLSYQYCRSLGLQLASFETKEKVESMSQYLQNAGYSKYDFWTSGNRLGTGMFLWMSTGLPFNATFDYFENSHDAVSAGMLDPIDHNSNTSPQRTARDRYSKFSSGLEKGCVMLKAPGLRWAPEDCSAVKDFICEQTRCYYYNYGSIPVSSSQGRPIVVVPTTTAAPPTTEASTTAKQVFTTPLPLLVASSTAVPVAPIAAEAPAPVSADDDAEGNNVPYGALKHHLESATESDATEATEEQFTDDEQHQEVEEPAPTDEAVAHDDDEAAHNSSDEDQSMLPQYAHEEVVEDDVPAAVQSMAIDTDHSTTSVEQRLKEISEEVEKQNHSDNESDIGRQSFFSLSDLIKTLRPSDRKVIPQIDSDYSNTMRVLGETASVAGGAAEGRQMKGVEISTAPRAHH